ncbi:PREDICTED: mitoferrin-1-like [Amphimedon queenslandica]|uniref:Mitoferrin-1 n=1 Tax=Amphimedon queenslandica TaxID=400682 RepID=A0A1X7TW79_AMPQE|nr:PREDICTED: mitoferrin-1-like [Amphimedon queenslandica]|eukprot:XP_003389716.2 PREDICTED: mitoferrin-1-like [Amphimedon queenslandica]
MEYPASVEQSVTDQTSPHIDSISSSSTPAKRERHQASNNTESMGEVDYESLPTDKLWAHLLAGGAAGVTEHCVMYPVDCVKTRMMTLVPNPKANYNNLYGAFKTIIKTERPSALFRGITVVATGAGPAHALYFSTYEYSKRWLSRHHNNIMSQGGAAVVATLLHDGCMNPIEVIKQRLQMYNAPYKGIIHCGATILRQEGPGAFYRSYTTQLTMNIPFQVLHFVSYEYLQEKFNPTRSYDPLSHMISGAGAGAIAAAFTTPLDVARTLLNTREQKKILASDKKIYGMLNTLLKIYQLKGFKGYFRGLSARVVYQMPSTALCWSVYELFKYGLGLKEAEFVETTPSDHTSR